MEWMDEPNPDITNPGFLFTLACQVLTGGFQSPQQPGYYKSGFFIYLSLLNVELWERQKGISMQSEIGAANLQNLKPRKT